MAKVKKGAEPVELNDALKSGVHDAMDRVKDLALDPYNTLVDRISEDDWNSWDEADENPNVCDRDGFDGNGFGLPDGSVAA